MFGSISDAVTFKLWAESNGLCCYSFDDVVCHSELLDSTPSGKLVNLANRAHIAPIGGDGPRSHIEPIGGELHGYDNLILLCTKHHTFIDRDPALFHGDCLVLMKERHVRAVDARPRLAQTAQEVDQAYDRFVTLMHEGLAVEKWKQTRFHISDNERWRRDERDAAILAVQKVRDWEEKPSEIPRLEPYSDRDLERAIVALADAYEKLIQAFHFDPHKIIPTWEDFLFEAQRPDRVTDAEMVAVLEEVAQSMKAFRISVANRRPPLGHP